MKIYKRILAFVLALMIAASAILLVSCSSEKEKETTTAPASTEQTFAYTIHFVCVDAEGKQTTREIKTNEKFLRGALEQEKLVKGTETEYGLNISEVCGIRADWTLDGAYWAIYVGEEYAQTGVDAIELQDGATYKFVYTKADA